MTTGNGLLVNNITRRNIHAISLRELINHLNFNTMDRRKFLKNAVVLPAFSFGGLSLLGNEIIPAPFAVPFRRVRPGDPGWPSATA